MHSKLFHPIYVYTYVHISVGKEEKMGENIQKKKRGNIEHVFRIKLNHE